MGGAFRKPRCLTGEYWKKIDRFHSADGFCLHGWEICSRCPRYHELVGELKSSDSQLSSPNYEPSSPSYTPPTQSPAEEDRDFDSCSPSSHLDSDSDSDSAAFLPSYSPSSPSYTPTADD